MQAPDNTRTSDYQNLPGTIWIYWDQGEQNAPFLIKHCIASWRIHNPGWTVHVVDRASLGQTIDMEGLDHRKDIPLQALSDLIRVKLLVQHGGVWADASLFCMRPLDSWLPEYFIDHFFAFASERKDRVMTTWFLAGNEESALLREWATGMIGFWRSNRFREKSYWGKQIIRKLMSLRKRNILSNDVWFSDLLLKRLGLFPYPINMYLFQRTLDLNPYLKTSWLNRHQLYDTPAEYLQNKLGMNAPLNEVSETFIANTGTPVHKLNWRQDLGRAVKGSNLDRLISLLNSTKEN